MDAITAEGGKASFHAMDITIPESIEKLVEDTVSTYGRIDVLVNNAANVGLKDGRVDEICLPGVCQEKTEKKRLGGNNIFDTFDEYCRLWNGGRFGKNASQIFSTVSSVAACVPRSIFPQYSLLNLHLAAASSCVRPRQ